MLGKNDLLLLQLVPLGEDAFEVKCGRDYYQVQEPDGDLAPVLKDDGEGRHDYTRPWYFCARLKITRGYSLTAW